MDSEGTREPSLAALRRHEGLEDPELPLDFLQGSEPKLRADDWHPVSWPADPRLEWCPPGHGDLYTALAASGALEALLAAGVRWASCRTPTTSARSPTCASRRGSGPRGALRPRGGAPDADGPQGRAPRPPRRVALVLRETAQVPEGDDSFTDIERFSFFNTNNLWVDLEHLRALAGRRRGRAVPATDRQQEDRRPDRQVVDGRCCSWRPRWARRSGRSTDARALEVPRTRFAPVKTTDDLLVARSDLYDLTDDGRMVPTWRRTSPVVELEKAPSRCSATSSGASPAAPRRWRGRRR